MKINDNFFIEKDAHNYVLVEKTTRINQKTKAETTGEKKQYYPTLELCCIALVKNDIDVENMETIISSIKKSTTDIIIAIQTQGVSINESE